jgi:hypothetical protein
MASVAPSRPGNALRHDLVEIKTSKAPQHGIFKMVKLANPPLYKYIGCYRDKNIRAFPADLGKMNSIVRCAELAQARGFTHFGLQHNSQCFAGSNLVEIKKYGALKDTDCMLEFTGHGSVGKFLGMTESGGAWTNAVYQVTQPSIPGREVAVVDSITIGSKVRI